MIFIKGEENMMKNPVMFNKALIVVILFLFIGIGFNSVIGGDFLNDQDISTVTFYVFDRIGVRECEVSLSCDGAGFVSSRFEDLIDKISVDPSSVESKLLKADFVDLLDSYGLVPDGVSKDYVVSLLSPWWLGFVGRVNPFVRFDGSSVRDGFFLLMVSVLLFCVVLVLRDIIIRRVL